MSTRTVRFSLNTKKFSTVVVVVALGLVVGSCGSGGEPESMLVKSATTHKSFLVCLLDPATSARDCYTEFPQHRSSPTTGKQAGQRIAGAKLARYVADYRIPLSDVQVVSTMVGNSLSSGHSSTEAYRMMRASGLGDISLNDKTLAGLTDLVLLAHYPGAGPREIRSCTASERCYHSGPQPPSNNRSTVRPG
jgi:hypothetical protein